jgi:TPR repeat protein
MLYNGEGVAPYPAGAAKLFMKAAARDNPIAQDRLAHLYVVGRGVPKSLVDAAVMRALAEDHGLKDPQLDAELAGLTADQQKAVDAALRKRSAFASPVIQE